MKLKKEEVLKFENCLEQVEKKCTGSKDKAECILTESKNFDYACSKVYKKSAIQMGHLGSNCLGLFKLCPIKVKADQEEFSKFQKCIYEKLDKVPLSCQKVMEQMYKANTGEKMSFKEMLKKVNDSPSRPSGENIIIKNK